MEGVFMTRRRRDPILRHLQDTPIDSPNTPRGADLMDRVQTGNGPISDYAPFHEDDVGE
jgi:hypothetical protein